jgi:hypothetical protein
MFPFFLLAGNRSLAHIILIFFNLDHYKLVNIKWVIFFRKAAQNKTSSLVVRKNYINGLSDRKK